MRSKWASTAYTKGWLRYGFSRDFTSRFYNSGAATTASRLGQPDLAVATLNDFVGVSIGLVFVRDQEIKNRF